ncbi:MAG: hypothetical protein LC623_08630 [Halobacteriales archaeon]|nr:hypothetical protein [Halobacteriales archaeon]
MGLRRLRHDLGLWRRWRTLEAAARLAVELDEIPEWEYADFLVALDRPEEVRSLGVVLWNGLMPEKWRR